MMSAATAFAREPVLEEARRLPAAPQVMAGLSELLENVNTDLDSIAAQISLDPALVSRVIRIGNSPIFGVGTRVASVQEAVNRVGFNEVLRLVGVATVGGMVDRALVCYGIPAERLRESLLLHALAAEAIAEAAGIDPRSAYAAGILRCLGMMVADRLARPLLTVEENYQPRDFRTYADWERARFGRPAVEFTAMILQEWRLPVDVIGAVREHLDPIQRSNPQPFACVLNLAGAITTANDLALPGEIACWMPDAETLAGGGIDEAAFNAAAEKAARLFERQRAALY